MNRRNFLLKAAGLLSVPYSAWATPVMSGQFRLRLLDAHTGATFDGIYRDGSGPIARVMEELSVFLRDHHCDEIQGYYFSKPVSPIEFSELVRRHAMTTPN